MIPQPEVSDSTFGAFQEAAQRFENHRPDQFSPFSRVSHAIGCSRYVSADSYGRVRLSSTTGMVTIADTMTPEDAAALASELLAAACAAKTAIRSLS